MGTAATQREQRPGVRPPINWDSCGVPGRFEFGSQRFQATWPRLLVLYGQTHARSGVTIPTGVPTRTPGSRHAHKALLGTQAPGSANGQLSDDTSNPAWTPGAWWRTERKACESG